MSKEITEDHWSYHNIDELKNALCGWLDDTIDNLGGEREVSSRVDAKGKLHFKIHDVVLTDLKDTGDEQDLYVSVENIESLPNE